MLLNRWYYSLMNFLIILSTLKSPWSIFLVHISWMVRCPPLLYPVEITTTKTSLNRIYCIIKDVTYMEEIRGRIWKEIWRVHCNNYWKDHVLLIQSVINSVVYRNFVSTLYTVKIMILLNHIKLCASINFNILL